MDTFDTKTIRKIMDSFSNAGAADDPKEIKRKKILNAASKLFEKFGYRKTSIDDIAKSAGIAKGTVYLYFKTKADIVIQVIVEEKQKQQEQIMLIFEENDPRLRLKKWIETIFTIGPKMPINARLMRGDQEIMMVLAEMDPAVKEKSEKFQQMFIGWMIKEATASQELSEKEIADKVKVLTSFVYTYGIYSDHLERAGLSGDEYPLLVADMIIDGIINDKLK